MVITFLFKVLLKICIQNIIKKWLVLTRRFFQQVYYFSCCEDYDQVTKWCNTIHCLSKLIYLSSKLFAVCGSLTWKDMRILMLNKLHFKIQNLLWSLYKLYQQLRSNDVGRSDASWRIWSPCVEQICCHLWWRWPLVWFMQLV